MLSPKIDPNTFSLSHLGLLLFEAGLIVLSVLLGLLANQWRIASANEEQAEQSLRAIHAELQGNYEQVERLLPYHRRVDDSLDVLIERIAAAQSAVITPVEFRRAALPEGFSTPLLQTNAWEMANRTGAINHIDFELASDLSSLYNLQAFYQRKLDKVGENWYVAGNVNPTNFAATTMATGILVNDIVHQEEDLVERYPEMIERLNDAVP